MMESADGLKRGIYNGGIHEISQCFKVGFFPREEFTRSANGLKRDTYNRGIHEIRQRLLKFFEFTRPEQIIRHCSRSKLEGLGVVVILKVKKSFYYD